MAGSHGDGRSEIHFKQGSCSIILKQGDIFDENDVDVIVIPTPSLSEPNPDTFAIYNSIYSTANENFKGEIRRVRSNLTFGNPEVISRNGRGHIFVVPPYMGNPTKARDYLKKTYTSCLNLAVKNNFRRIAFPTIGCGVIGFDISDAGRSVYSAFEIFGQSKDGKKMDEIRVIVYSSGIWTGFTTAFMEPSYSKSAKLKFIDILTTNSNPSVMSSRRDEKRTSQEEKNDYPDDFDDGTVRDQRGHVKRQTSGLNPESPEYQPSYNNQHRGLRRYLLSNKRTELHILQGDILETKVDAIVNAANESMLGGGGVDGVIHRAAGDELRRACKAHKPIYPDVRLPTGRSRILLSYNMSRTTYYIINTAGPRYDRMQQGQCKEELISCYKTSLALANLYDLKTIGFTAISCGIFGYPLDEGAEVALTTVDNNADLMSKISFVLMDNAIYDAWAKKAEQLQFISLDDKNTVATNTSKQLYGNTQATMDKSDVNNESKSLSSMKVVEESAAANTQTSTEFNRENSREKLPSDPNKTSDRQELVENEEDDKTTRKKSEKTDSDNPKQTETSNNSFQQKQINNEDQYSQTQEVTVDSKKSQWQPGFGRGKRRT